MCNTPQSPAHNAQNRPLAGSHIVVGQPQRHVTGGEGALVPVPVARELLLGGVELVSVLLDDEPALDKCVDLTDAFEHGAGLDLQSGLP